MTTQQQPQQIMIAIRSHAIKLCGIVCILFAFSCVEDLKHDLKMKDFKFKIVVNCTFTSDSTWKINISETSDVKSGENWSFIDNAEATITDANGMDTQLQAAGDGQYVIAQTPEYNQHYKLKVLVPGFEPIEADGFQPEPMKIETLSFKDSVSSYDSSYLSQTLVTISDNGAQTNFYQVIVYQRDGANQIVPLLLKSDDTAFENIPNNSIINGTSEFQEYLVANDQSFNGKTYTFNLKLIKAIPDSDLFVELRSLSPELHGYVLSYTKFTDNIDNPFAEPVAVYTNIKNGLGIFGGYSSYTQKIKL